MEENATLATPLEALRGAGEETRLRILFALSGGELAVAELTEALGQSQPRISRHLKLMVESGLIERRREGAWAFFRLCETGFAGRLIALILSQRPADDPALARDAERLAAARTRRLDAAQRYIAQNAARWDDLCAVHAPIEAVTNAAMDLLRPVGAERFARLLDLGAGDGRMLEAFANRYAAAVGYDLSPEMLTVARARLARAGIAHAEMRRGDILALPEDSAEADAAICNMVLHFLDQPGRAINEAARCLKPGGLLLLSDFAPHDLEALREAQAHRRLGFSTPEIAAACAAAGLRLREVRSVPPPADSAAALLTVTLWLCERV